MLKRLKSAGLVPALVVTAVLAASLIVPASANFLLNGVTPGCGYGYPTVGTPTVSNVNPNAGPPSGGTSVAITGTNFCNVTAVKFGAVDAASYVVNSRTKITAVSPAGAAGTTVDVTVTNTIGTSATSAADHFTYVADRLVACSVQQYRLHGSDGVTWNSIDATNLSIGFTATADGVAEFGGNADLWTEQSGYNQDLGVTVLGGTSPSYPTTAGQPEAWKESGGYAGTRSPNAAFVQTVVPVKAGQSYVALLTWKTNRADPGYIDAGAGPIQGRFSQTCITAQLIYDGSLTSVRSTQQYQLSGSNGTTWQTMDAAHLQIVFTAPGDGSLMIGGNSDLWTEKAGYNQDLGIMVSSDDDVFPTVAGQPDAWKESGGFAGTRSPNAAFVSDVIPVGVDVVYTINLVWKTNIPDSNRIDAGAGPSAPFSPTGLTVQFFPSGSGPLDKVSRLQYTLTASDGATWQAVDPFNMIAAVTPSVDCQVWVGANADLWTGDAGFNQDLGVAVADGTYPSFPNQPEGWKESGGFAGTRSPNAAYDQTVVNLTAGHTYTFVLVWKTNINDPHGSIHIGAGPSAPFSPTRLTLTPVGCTT